MRRAAALSRGALVCVAGAVLLTQWGCAPNRVAPRAEAANRETVVSPPRSPRGNPPFYDVLGRRYYVQDSSDGYHERGVASWYGRKFHGLPTSSGETYDMHAMTAAHTTLPIPTWVEVTHLGNGRRVIVKINDRGPFLHDRLIDLSYGAAQALDMVGEGTARVEVRALGASAAGRPETRGATASAAGSPRSGLAIISDAAAATPGPGDRPMRQVYVQVGAFSERRNARALVARLEAAGHGRVFIDSDRGGDSLLHRVRIGPFHRAGDVELVLGELSASGIEETHLVLEH